MCPQIALKDCLDGSNYAANEKTGPRGVWLISVTCSYLNGDSLMWHLDLSRFKCVAWFMAIRKSRNVIYSAVHCIDLISQFTFTALTHYSYRSKYFISCSSWRRCSFVYGLIHSRKSTIVVFWPVYREFYVTLLQVFKLHLQYCSLSLSLSGGR